MSIMTLEGVVDHGQIILKTKVDLPDNTKVYVVVPDIQVQGTARIRSPHLAHREKVKEFKLEVVEEPKNDEL